MIVVGVGVDGFAVLVLLHFPAGSGAAGGSPEEGEECGKRRSVFAEEDDGHIGGEEECEDCVVCGETVESLLYGGLAELVDEEGECEGRSTAICIDYVFVGHPLVDV